MIKISKFLNIKFEKIFTKATHFRKEILTKNKKRYVGNILHSETEILLKTEKKFLSFIEYKNNYNFIILIKYLYLSLG